MDNPKIKLEVRYARQVISGSEPMHRAAEHPGRDPGLRSKRRGHGAHQFLISLIR
jgi:hypothetical protein